MRGLFLLLLLSGCHGGNKPAQPSNVDVSKHGAPLTGAAPAKLGAVLASPDGFAGKPVTVDATVRKACTKKGCWMELADGEAACRVTFKDYGFFVPTDAAGARARVEGLVDVRTIDAPQVQHLEGEGAKFANKLPDGSAKEVRIVATGVELSRPRL